MTKFGRIQVQSSHPVFVKETTGAEIVAATNATTTKPEASDP